MPAFFKQHITVGNERIATDLLTTNSTFTPCLCIHGAGQARKELFHPLRKYLFSHKVSTLGFDFSGHGHSSGILTESSLEKRLQETLSVYQYYWPDTPVNVIASSMGAHTAIMLLQHMPVQNLILFSPAAYAKQAQRMQFNGSFSHIIRLPQSYRTSPTFSAIEQFTGGLLMYYGSNDEIVPENIPQKYLQAAQNSTTKNLVILDAIGNNILAQVNTNTNQLLQISRDIFTFLYI